MKRFLALILFASMLLTLLVSCKKEEPVTEAYINDVHLSEYVIVYSANGLDYDKRAAEYIRDSIKARTDIDVAIVTDATAVAAHEIVVGETNRAISKKLNAECEGVEFSMLADGGHVAMEGDYFIIAAAAYFFVDSYVPTGDGRKTVPSEAKVHQPIVKEAKNYIVLIGDGMGVNQTKIFDYKENNIEYGDGEDLFYGYLLPYMGSSRTQSLSGVTDSAAGGTALSTGHKTINEYIGRDGNGNDVQSLTELAATLGKATAVMSTESNTGATPAAFSAHANDRDSSGVISDSQLVTRQQYGTILDCGYDYYTKKMVDGSIEKHLTDNLAKLEQNENGFFMMYEEAHIDKHCHNNELDKAYQAIVRFNQVIARVMEYAFYNPETFVLITADHETGDLYEEDGQLVYHHDDHTANDVLIFAYGMGAELFDGQNVENIQIAHTIASFWGVYDFGDQSQYSYLGKE
ncbi:MAG: alkaline phosphatase [Clostridia bacterium]|nr:alkaline phosphatase [Clostridia bacterium]